jgi:hypothetical protein
MSEQRVLVGCWAQRELARQVDERAAADRRSRSMWLQIQLEKILTQQPTEDHAA